MRNLFKKIAAVSVTVSMLMTGGIMAPVNAEELNSTGAVTVEGSVNQVGMYSLYDYQYWNDSQGSIETNFKLGGAFDFTWNDVNDAMCMTGDLFVRKAKDADLNDIEIRDAMYGKPVIDYRGKVESDGNYILGAYGWFDKQRTEFMIIDDWGSQNPAEFAGELIGSIEVDGGTYDIYKRYNGSFDDPNPITTIRSIRREKRSTENGYVEGTISVYEHFREWQKSNIITDSPYEIMLAAEGINSSGTIHITRNSVYYLFDEDNDNTEVVGTGPDFDPGEEYKFPDTLNDTVFTEMASDERDGYYFNLLPYPTTSEESEFSLELGEGGKFKCSWDKDGMANFDRGLQYYNSERLTRSVVRKYDGEGITIDYAADFKPEGSAIIGGHGWLNNLNVEYFIVEAWKDWEVPEGSESLGAVGLNDGIYELYKAPDNYFYSTIYSVRRENKLGEDPHIEGTINLADHFYAWEKYGISPVDPDYVDFSVTSYSGSGSADITKNVIKIDGVDIQESAAAAPAPTGPVEATQAPADLPDTTVHGVAGGIAIPTYIIGDLNHDLSVDAFDVVISRRELVKSINGEEPSKESDVDSSGDTRINDLILVTKIAMGADVRLPKKTQTNAK